MPRYLHRVMKKMSRALHCSSGLIVFDERASGDNEGLSNSPGNADGMKESIISKNVDEFGGCSAGAHYAKHRKHCVPQR